MNKEKLIYCFKYVFDNQYYIDYVEIPDYVVDIEKFMYDFGDLLNYEIVDFWPSYFR